MSDVGFPDPADPVDATALVADVPPSPPPPDPVPPRVGAFLASEDAEMVALVMMRTVLEPLSPAARRRVLRWAAEKFTAPGVSSSGG